MQDATPIRFAQEVSGWREMVAVPCRMLESSLTELRRLAIGGTAAGTGLNAPQGVDAAVCRKLSVLTGVAFIPDENKRFTRYIIESLNDIYQYKDELIAVVQRYM